MEIRYSKAALKTLQSYDKYLRQRIRNKIKGLALTPPLGDIKALSGEKSVYRLRVGKFRVLFEYNIEEVVNKDGTKDEKKVLSIIDIDSRGEIYK